MRVRMDIGKHEGKYAYLDISISNFKGYDEIKVMNFITKQLEENFYYDYNFKVVNCPSLINNVYVDSISFEYSRGEMGERYKEIRNKFIEIKSNIKKIQNGSRLR